jgi:hypothetical protein
MDFNDFLDDFNEEQSGRDPAFTAMIEHLADGIAAGRIGIRELVAALFTITYPEHSPGAVDIEPFFYVAADVLGRPDLIRMYHSMWLIHIPGAFGMMMAGHRDNECPNCKDSLPLAPEGSDDDLLVNKILCSIMRGHVPSDLNVELDDRGQISIVKVDFDAAFDHPDLQDKLVDSFRQEIDEQLPTVGEDPKITDWMKRWMK